MSIEIILFGVVALVLVLDFALKGVKKRTTQDDVDRIGEEQSKKKAFNFNYILARKRNILTFILLVILFKPIIHYFFSTEYLEITSSDKTYIGANEPTYVLLNGIKISDTIYFHNFKTGKSYFDKSDNNRESLFIGNEIFLKTNQKLPSIFYGKSKWQSSTDKRFIQKLKEKVKFKKNLANYLYKNSYSGFDIKKFQLISDNSEFKKLYNGTILDSLIVDKWIADGKIEKPEITFYYSDISFISFNESNPSTLKNFTISNKIDYKYFLIGEAGTEDLHSANGEKIYFVGVANDEQTYNPYSDEWSYNGSWEKKFYYYKKTIVEASFNFHFRNIFKLKLWLFAVSFASLGVLVFLFNDKIKVR